MSKLISLLIVCVLGYQNQVAVVKNLKLLKDVSPIIQTYLEMDSFKSLLAAYASENNGHLPENIGEWLNQNIKSKGKNDTSIDYFGTPYQVVIDNDTSREFLVSCGPDKECNTSDDIGERM